MEQHNYTPEPYVNGYQIDNNGGFYRHDEQTGMVARPIDVVGQRLVVADIFEAQKRAANRQRVAFDMYKRQPLPGSGRNG